MRLRLFVILMVVFAGHPLAAQNKIDYTPLANRLADYGRLTMDWDIDGLLDMTVPELFEFVPRNLLYERMAGLRSDDNMEVKFYNFTIDRIGEGVTERGRSYVSITCHHSMAFHLLSGSYRNTEFSARMVRMLEKSYPHVIYDPKAHSIQVEVPKLMYAIRSSETEDWYFVEYRPENAALMDLLVPPTVREQLK